MCASDCKIIVAYATQAYLPISMPCSCMMTYTKHIQQNWSSAWWSHNGATNAVSGELSHNTSCGYPRQEEGKGEEEEQEERKDLLTHVVADCRRAVWVPRYR